METAQNIDSLDMNQDWQIDNKDSKELQNVMDQMIFEEKNQFIQDLDAKFNSSESY